MDRNKQVDLVSFRCDNCNSLGGGCRVIDYAGALKRVMLPIGWSERTDRMPGNTRMILFLCPKCTEAATHGS